MFEYNQNNNNDTCVAIAFARPVEFNSPVRNVKLVLEDLKKANIPVFTIELLFDNQTNIIPNPTKTVRANTRIVSKENLWNLLEKEIPEQYSKIIFLDADIRFTNPNWFNESAVLLDKNFLIQPHSEVYFNLNIDSDYSSPDMEKIIFYSTAKSSIAKGIKERTLKYSIHDSWVGFSIGVTRKFYKDIRGFYDKGIMGQGDTLFWNCFIPTYVQSEEIIQTENKLYSYYLYHKKNVQWIYDKIDYVKDCIACHLFHGTKQNRDYDNRCKKQPNEKYLSYNKDGVIELNEPKLLKEHFKNFKKREEDEECPSYIVSQLIKLANEQPLLLTENIVKHSDHPDIYQNLYKHHIKCDLCKQEYKQILNEKS